MHTRKIDPDAFADLHPEMAITSQISDGPLMAKIATHPELGRCLVVQDALDGGVVLVSELPREEAAST